MSSEYASIGKAILKYAIGVQGNYTRLVNEIDEYASGCAKCPFSEMIKAGLRDRSVCEGCNKCVFTQKAVTTYRRSENSKHIYTPVLKTNSLKFFIYLHFNCTSNGIVINHSIKDAAKALNVDVRTVDNLLKDLEDYCYIEYSRSRGKFSVSIRNYKSYFLTAEEGGHGYVVMNSSLLDFILKLNDINSLRITLSELVRLDKNISRTASYKDIQSYLPKYCKKGIVNKALSDLTIFSISKDVETVHIRLKEEYTAKFLKSKKMNEAEEKFKRFVLDFEMDVRGVLGKDYSYVNDEHLDILMQCKNYVIYIPSAKDIQDIRSLSLEYNVDEIIKAFPSIYLEYISKGTKKEIGSLIRQQLIRKDNKEDSAA